MVFLLIFTDYLDYRKLKQSSETRNQKSKKQDDKPAVQKVPRKKRTYKEQRELEALMDSIAKMEEEKKDLELLFFSKQRSIP